MRISDWSSDVCSSDLAASRLLRGLGTTHKHAVVKRAKCHGTGILSLDRDKVVAFTSGSQRCQIAIWCSTDGSTNTPHMCIAPMDHKIALIGQAEIGVTPLTCRSEEQTSELQSLMRNSYAVL